MAQKIFCKKIRGCEEIPGLTWKPPQFWGKVIGKILNPLGGGSTWGQVTNLRAPGRGFIQRRFSGILRVVGKKKRRGGGAPVGLFDSY